jgi:hypothetical protein
MPYLEIEVPADAAPAVLELIIIAHMELEAIAERCIAGDPTWRERLNQVVNTLSKLERTARRGRPQAKRDEIMAAAAECPRKPDGSYNISAIARRSGYERSTVRKALGK